MSESDGELRKRTRTPRERSLSPIRNVPSTDVLGSLKERIEEKLPEVIFTDEFHEIESGVTTCLVGGITCGYDELIEFNKLPYELRFEDGRLCLTHTPGTVPEVMFKYAKKRLSSKHIFVFLLWLFSGFLIWTLIATFGEKYSELIANYST